jgi:hypothetical protein
MIASPTSGRLKGTIGPSRPREREERKDSIESSNNGYRISQCQSPVELWKSLHLDLW